MTIKFNTSTISVTKIVLIVVVLTTAAVRVQAGGSEICKKLNELDHQVFTLLSSASELAEDMKKQQLSYEAKLASRAYGHMLDASGTYYKLMQTSTCD
jgi:outer membrane murein-binding lipoprotein Lpp